MEGDEVVDASIDAQQQTKDQVVDRDVDRRVEQMPEVAEDIRDLSIPQFADRLEVDVFAPSPEIDDVRSQIHRRMGTRQLGKARRVSCGGGHRLNPSGSTRSARRVRCGGG